MLIRLISLALLFLVLTITYAYSLEKNFIFPKLRVFYFKIAVLFYNIKDKLSI